MVSFQGRNMGSFALVTDDQLDPIDCEDLMKTDCEDLMKTQYALGWYEGELYAGPYEPYPGWP